MTPLVAYLLLFVAIGAAFILVHLLAGKLIRPSKPDSEKGTTYECGEPTIGSAWVQFDLRFYVVALLFVIFDVEVAFFFPWAEVFGKANDLAALPAPTTAEEYRALAEQALLLTPPGTANHDLYVRMASLTQAEVNEYNALKQRVAQRPSAVSGAERAKELDWAKMQLLAKNTRTSARSLGWMAFVDILVFFGVLLVGFAYLWRRGDLAWVRSVAAERRLTPPASPSAPAPAAESPALVSSGTSTSV
jgi:NADH-quinone oxidoreductase subunit A